MTTVLQFSGGKDSLACLLLHKADWDSLYVVWVNTGAAYDGVISYMDMWRKRLPHFLEVKSNQPKNISEFGFPSDVVPVNSTAFARNFVASSGPLIQPYLACCAANIWLPMQNTIKSMGATKVIRGQRNNDKRRASIKSGDVIDGIEYVFPLQDWTEKDVFQFLQSTGERMPPGYDAGEQTGRDCWDCTAYLDENQQRIANLPEDRRKIVCGRIAQIKTAIANQWHGCKGD